MRRNALLLAAVAAILVTGCATPDSQSQSSQSSAAQRDDKYRHVGSHLPSKDAGRSVNDNVGTKTDVYNDAMRRPSPANPGN